MKRILGILLFVGGVLQLTAPLATAQVGPQLGAVDWVKVHDAAGVPSVRFHLHWANPDPAQSSVPVSGVMRSQPFGVFQPDFGPIGSFNVPPMAPNSFFDVFFDVALSQLPPEPEKRLPSVQSPGTAARPQGDGRGAGPASVATVPCSPDTIWSGNVDVVWAGAGVTGHVEKHYGELIVCPGGGPSYIHVKSTDCPIGAPWSVTGLCPGFSATLVNESLTPAPNPIPPGWTGFIAITAGPAVLPGTTCCFTLNFTCETRPATIQMCVTACECQPAPHGPTIGQVEWHNVGPNVRFHLRWENPDALTASTPINGIVRSQEFGVFMPDFGTSPIGGFNVPPLAPNSFFDVFFDVPLSALPPEPLKILPGGQSASMVASAGRPGASPASVTSIPCPPDTIWDGNVDILWTGPAGPGQVLRHFGDLIVCPGGGPTFIHVKSTTCAVPAPWSVAGLCPGFAVTLVNEDFSPAPNPIPPAWTGFISVTATAAVAAGTVCCPVLSFDCAGSIATIDLCATACDCGHQGPTLSQVDWHNIGTDVRFHLRWENPSPNAPTDAMSGEMKSQAFGVFQPDFGPIGAFNVPPLQPNSFFDVFFDVPLSQLPPQPAKVLPGAGPLAGTPCPADTIWDGNVDIAWSGTGGQGQVNKHYGDLVVCPGGAAPSLIHVPLLACPTPVSWSVTGLCPGFNATLVNEDFSVAPNPLPVGWTGYLAVHAAVGVVPGTVCCLTFHFDCGGVPATIELCATACDCGTLSVPPTGEDLGFGIRSAVPNPTSGALTIRYATPRESRTKLEIFGVTGRHLRTLQDGVLTPGPHTVAWDGRSDTGQKLPAGTYFLKLTADGRVTSRKFMIVR